MSNPTNPPRVTKTKSRSDGPTDSSPAPSGGTDAPAPARAPGAGSSLLALPQRWRLGVLGSRYALVGVWVAMIVLYTVLLPGKFFRLPVLQTLLSSQSVLLFLALASLCTFVVGEFDLSFAAIMGLSATMIPVLAGLHHVNLALTCLIALATSVACGALNALFIVKLGVPALVITLGSASLYLGLAEWISSSNTVSLSRPGFSKIALTQVFGVSASFYYGLLLTIAFAYLLAWTPTGRHMVFVGANREVARLAGINVNRIRAMSYIVAGLIAGIAGLLLVASVGGIDPTASSGYLLPALAAVFLGTAVVLPGQFNPIGTFIGIFFLETGILGLQLLGYTGWVQDAFYGGGLVLAVTLATLVRNHTKTT